MATKRAPCAAASAPGIADALIRGDRVEHHGLTVPLSVWTPNPGEAWPCPVVPLLVNVIQYPQPTAARCYALGRAMGRDGR